MQIELSRNDVRILKEALDCWEKDAMQGALIGGMFGAMMTGKDERETERGRFRQEMEASKRDAEKRRDQATLIRAALIRAEAVIGEHEQDAAPGLIASMLKNAQSVP